MRSGPSGPSSSPTARPSLGPLSLLLLGALLAFGVACGGSGNAQDVLPTATSLPPTSLPTLPPPTPKTAPLPTDSPAVDPTATPEPTPISTRGDRTDCNAIRGTAYRSAAEREFFLANCTGSVVAPPTPASTSGDRTSCDEIRGTAYRSATEREFFLANCISGQPTPTPSNPIISPAGGATAIGDSVMLGAAPYLQSTIGGIYVDATVSRQASSGAAVLQQRAQANSLGSVVVIGLGNNGTFTVQEFDGIMALLADVPRVVIVNISVPRTWEGSNNDMLAANVGRYANARLVDWHTAALNHPEFFWEDRVHLRPAGATVYAAMIAYAAVA